MCQRILQVIRLQEGSPIFYYSWSSRYDDKGTILLSLNILQLFSQHGDSPKVHTGRNSTPDNIRELASHIGKLPYSGFSNTIQTFEFYSGEEGKKVYNCDIYLDR